jgi:hypothetical protein
LVLVDAATLGFQRNIADLVNARPLGVVTKKSNYLAVESVKPWLFEILELLTNHSKNIFDIYKKNV